MASVSLRYSDIGLFSDFPATRVILPRVSSLSPSRKRDLVSVTFEGNADPTPFRGEAQSRSLPLVVRYMEGEHDRMADLLDLFDLAHTAADGRLALRLNSLDDSRLIPFEVVTVSDDSSAPVAGSRAWDVSFTAQRVLFTIEV